MNKKAILITTSALCFTGAALLMKQAAKRYRVDPYSVACTLAADKVQLMTALRYAGWEEGEPWCMYFCKACYMIAYPRYAFLLYRLLTGYTQPSWQRAGQSYIVQCITSGGMPKRGDILVWQKNDELGSGHAAIIGNRISGNNWEIVEGNNDLWGPAQTEKCLRIVQPERKGEYFTQLGMIRIR